MNIVVPHARHAAARVIAATVSVVVRAVAFVLPMPRHARNAKRVIYAAAVKTALNVVIDIWAVVLERKMFVYTHYSKIKQ